MTARPSGKDRQHTALGSEVCNMMGSGLLGECSRGRELSIRSEFFNSVIGGQNYDEFS